MPLLCNGRPPLDVRGQLMLNRGLKQVKLPTTSKCNLILMAETNNAIDCTISAANTFYFSDVLDCMTVTTDRQIKMHQEMKNQIGHSCSKPRISS